MSRLKIPNKNNCQQNVSVSCLPPTHSLDSINPVHLTQLLQKSFFNHLHLPTSLSQLLHSHIMGSFNTTCFVSQQTIIPGSKCVILPLIQQSTYDLIDIQSPDGTTQFSVLGHAHSTCYPTCFWSYFGPIIRGSYYDYGKFELDNTLENTQALVSLFDSLLTESFITRQGANSCHDVPFDMSDLYSSEKSYTLDELVNIWDTVWNVTVEHRLFVSDHTHHPRQPRPFKFAVMHSKAAEYLIQSTSNRTSYSGQSYNQYDYFESYITEKLSKIKFDDSLITRFKIEEIGYLKDYRVGDYSGLSMSLFYSNSEAISLLTDMCKSGDYSSLGELFKIMKPHLDHRYIHSGLNDFNIKLSPMVYARQDYCNEMGDSYLDLVKAINQDVKAYVTDRYGDD